MRITEEDVMEVAVATSLRREIARFGTLQVEDGHWPGDYGGPLFLMPGTIITLQLTRALNTVLATEHQWEMCRYFYNQQNEDGGWGLHIEGQSTMLGSVMVYVALRLLGGAEGGDVVMQQG